MTESSLNSDQMMNHTSKPTADALERVLDLSRLSPAAQSFVAAIAERADLPMRLAQMALVFKSREPKTDARALARAARQLSPDDFRVVWFRQACVTS